jgi:hypothetical protein
MMDDFSNNLICRHTCETQVLIDTYPPKLSNTRKKLLYSLTCPPGATHKGDLIFSRWLLQLLAARLSQVSTKIEAASGTLPPARTLPLKWKTLNTPC